MARIVFLRAANVGGRNVFRPTLLAAALAHLDVVNVGAAGTFVVRSDATPASIREEILARLPFAPALAIVPASEVLALVKRRPFAGVRLSKEVRGFVAVLSSRPRASPPLPVAAPPGAAWSVRVERVMGSFALGRWRRRPGGFVIPSAIVEDALGVPATTRWWETFLRIAEVLEAAAGGGRRRARAGDV